MLRDYQQNAVDAAVNFFKYRKGVHGYVTAAGGSGKSHMIAGVAERIFDMNVGRVVVLARSEKLLSQNRSKFGEQYQHRIGIYCAGLGAKELSYPITIASAQSIAGKSLDGVAVIIVDECDEISSDEESQYQTFFAACGNPQIIGFTATAFRTGTGKITWGEEIINIPIAPLFAAGYLTPPTNKIGTTLDLSHVDVRLGDYVQSQLDKIYDDPDLLAISVRKIKQYSAERSSVLIFCQSLRHCDILANAMEYNGMPCVTVSGDTDKEELGFTLEDFDRGTIKYLLNCQLLTRGYDMPAVDMIVLLLATKSKRKFEQMLYRGTRLHPNKKDFLVLDMGNNFATHGSLGSPVLVSGSKEAFKYMGRICPECEEYVTPLTARECTDCGYQFPEPERPKVSHDSEADTTSATVYTGTIDSYEVSDVLYKRHKGKANKPDTLRVDYYCGFGKYGNVSEWLSVMPEASQWARDKAKAFFKARGNEIGDPSEYEFDDLLWHAEKLKKPVRVTIDHSGEFPRIIRYEWPSEPQQSLEDLLGESL